MQIALLVALWLVYLFYGWPLRVKDAIKRHSGGGERQSGMFVVVVLFAFITIYVTLVLLGEAEGRPWQETGTVFTAMVITAGIFFTSIRLFPPTFYVAYSKVTDFKTGRHEDKRIDKLTIEKGRWWPIYLAFHNTSTFTWDNYRITIGLPSGFKASETVREFPNSRKWDYAPEKGGLFIGQEAPYVQKSSTTVLTIGETLAIRFFIKSKNSGSFKLRIMMTSAGRIGERRQSLELHVKEESQT